MVPRGRSEFGWRVVLTAAGVDTVSVLTGFLVGSLLVQIREDFPLSLSQLGYSVGAFFGVAALASVFAGRLVERIGWANGLRVAAALAVLAMAAVAAIVDSAGSLVTVSGLAGLASAFAHPSANLAVARCVPVERHGFLLGVRHAAVPTATLLGGLAVPAIGLTIGWRWAFVLGAASALALLASVPWRETDHVVNPVRDRAVRRIHPTHLRTLVVLAIAVGLAIAGIDALASFIVGYAVEIGVAEGTAGLLLASGSALGIVSRLVAGWRIDAQHRSDLPAVAGMLIAGSIGVAWIALGGTVGLFIGGLVAFAAGWGWSGLFTFAVVRDHPETPATATAITQSGKLVGAGLGPVAFGAIADGGSFAAAWWATCGVLLVGAVMMLAAHPARPSSREAAHG